MFVYVGFCAVWVFCFFDDGFGSGVSLIMMENVNVYILRNKCLYSLWGFMRYFICNLVF